MDPAKISSKKYEPMDFERFFVVFRIWLIQPVLCTVALVYLFHKVFGLERDYFAVAAIPTFLISWFLSVMLFILLNSKPLSL